MDLLTGGSDGEKSLTVPAEYRGTPAYLLSAGFYDQIQALCVCLTRLPFEDVPRRPRHHRTGTIFNGKPLASLALNPLKRRDLAVRRRTVVITIDFLISRLDNFR